MMDCPEPVHAGGRRFTRDTATRSGQEALAYHEQQADAFVGSDFYSTATSVCGGCTESMGSWIDYELARVQQVNAAFPYSLPKHFVSHTVGRSRAMSVRYSPDGTMLAGGMQLEGVRVWDTNSTKGFGTLGPPTVFVEGPSAQDSMGWSLLDLAWHPQSNYVVRSSWSSVLALCRPSRSTSDTADTQYFDAQGVSEQSFCVFGVDVMGDNVVCATNVGTVFVADLNTFTLHLRADLHALDVNCVTAVSPFVFASGGDDGVINVKDLRQPAQQVAVCLGHTHGITSLDSRGDERYLVSNSKDQTAKIFDLRRAYTDIAVIRAGIRQTHDSLNTIDYRAGPQAFTQFVSTRLDNSDRTLTGHNVYFTLLRARFSPYESTGGRFVACGAIDGKIGVFDVTTGELFLVTDPEFDGIVRDVDWHPDGTTLAAACVDGSLRFFSDKPMKDEDKQAVAESRRRAVAAQAMADDDDDDGGFW